MARKSKAAPEPEDVSQEEPAREIEPEPGGMNKSQAARAAIDAGYERPGEAVAHIKAAYGIDMSPTHFSAVRSNDRRKGGIGVKVRGKPKASPAAPKAAPRANATPAIPASGEADLLQALEAIKPLVASLGVDKVKRLAELLG